jgi:hypothetical protein
MKRFRIYDGFTECFTKKDKLAHANKLLKEYSDKLKSGWNPFTDDVKAIYEDSLTYTNVAKRFGAARASNKNFSYYSSLFLPEVKGMADVTYKNYVSKYRTFNEWLANRGIDGNDIATIDQDVMHQFFLWLINDPKMMLARITISKYKHMLSRLFDWMVKNKYLKESPMQELP